MSKLRLIVPLVLMAWFSPLLAMGEGGVVGPHSWRFELSYGYDFELQYQNLFPKPVFGAGAAGTMGLCLISPEAWRIGLSYYGNASMYSDGGILMIPYDFNSLRGASDSLKLSLGKEWNFGKDRFVSIFVEPQIGIDPALLDDLMKGDWAFITSSSRGPTWGVNLGAGMSWMIWEPLGLIAESHLAYRDYPDDNADVLGFGIGLRAICRF